MQKHKKIKQISLIIKLILIRLLKGETVGNSARKTTAAVLVPHANRPINGITKWLIQTLKRIRTHTKTVILPTSNKCLVSPIKIRQTRTTDKMATRNKYLSQAQTYLNQWEVTRVAITMAIKTDIITIKMDMVNAHTTVSLTDTLYVFSVRSLSHLRNIDTRMFYLESQIVIQNKNNENRCFIHI